MFMDSDICIKKSLICMSHQIFLKNLFYFYFIFCLLFPIFPNFVLAGEVYSKKQISVELLELESEAVKNHANTLKFIENRLIDSADDNVRQAYLYLFRVGLLQHSTSAVLEAELSKAQQLFDPVAEPELHIYSQVLKAFIMSKSPTLEKQSAQLLESLQEHADLQRDVYVYVKFLTIQISIYYQIEQYEKITRPLVRMAKTLNGKKIKQEIDYIQSNLNDALARHSSLIGDVERTKFYRLKQLVQDQNDGLSDDNAYIYCAIANIYNLPLAEKVYYARASLKAKIDGVCSQLMEKIVLLGEVLQGNVENVGELANIVSSGMIWQDELSAYYAGLAYLHLNDSSMALRMASLINREDSWEYQDLLQKSYQLQGDYQRALFAAQRYQRLREQKDAKAKSWMINTYQTRLELAQEDILSAEKAKQAEQLAAAEQKARARMQLMSTVVIAVLLTTVVLTLYLYRSRQLQQRLQVLSDTDPLTGLLNRRAFLSQVEKLRQLAQRQRFALSVVVIDLDYFKKINDQHGHQIGDAVLEAFASAAKDTIRKTDLIGRYGGEEFILATSQRDTTAIAGLLQRLQHSFAQLCIQDKRIAFEVSFSAGIASVIEPHTSHDLDIYEAIRQADEQLYRAKANGRQKVCTKDFCLLLITT